VDVVKTAGWALIRDKMLNKEYDATHFLSPMPLAISMGMGSNQVPMNVATIQNTNGQAITLANKHKDKRDPKMWKGFKFACRSSTACTTSCCATTWPRPA
jgi:nitrate/nitrite transport system substrate-binding protein